MFCINCGKELSDTTKFCYFCGTKVITDTYQTVETKIETQNKEMQKEESEQKTKTDLQLEEWIEKGKQALAVQNWTQAHQYFEQVVQIDYMYAEAYWGFVLLLNECRNQEEFITKYTKDAETIQQEFCEAVKHQETIQDAIEKYEVKGLLYKEKIQQIFFYEKDIGYTSEVSFREKQYETVKKYFEEDKYLKKVFQYADQTFNRKMVQIRERIYSVWEERFNTAKAQEKEQVDRIIQDYNTFLSQAKQQVEQEYQWACEQQNLNYTEACQYMNNGQYAIAIARFEKLEDFKNSRMLLTECQQYEKRKNQGSAELIPTTDMSSDTIGNITRNYENEGYPRRKKSVSGVWKVVGIAAVLVIIFFGIGFYMMEKEGEPYVQFVKTGHPNRYPGITYEEAFQSFFSNPSWYYFESEDGEDIVEFTGGCLYYNTEVTAKIQFILNVRDGTFEMYYFGLNDIPQSQLEMYLLLDTIFEDYQN